MAERRLPTQRDMTLEEVAELRRMTPRQLRDFVRRRKIPVLTTGKAIAFDRDALIALDDAMRLRPLTEQERAFSDALLSCDVPENPLSRDGEVYFISAESDVKIGAALDPIARMATLQIGSPVEPRLIGTMPGGAEAERRLHRRFARYRIRGEWFSATGLFRAFLKCRFGDA